MYSSSVPSCLSRLAHIAIAASFGLGLLAGCEIREGPEPMPERSTSLDQGYPLLGNDYYRNEAAGPGAPRARAEGMAPSRVENIPLPPPTESAGR